LAAALILAACPAESGSVTVIDISITGSANTIYAVGEAFNSAGLVVTVSYSDGSLATLTTGWTLSWNGAPLAEGSTAITETPGPKTIDVTYRGITVSFSITVSSSLYTVNGTITTSDGASAAGASVQLKASSGTAFGSPVTAGTGGTYTIPSVPPGAYTIEVSLSGYTSGTISSFTVSDTNITGKDLVLQKTIPSDTTPPGKVTALSAAAGNGEVTLTWTDPTDSDLASIEITWTPGNGNETVTKGTGTYTASGLTNGNAYTFTVRAKDTTGNLGDGETTTATPKDSTPPANVTGQSKIDGQGQVVLSWTDPTDADLASIEITWTPGGTTPVVIPKGTEKYTAVVANGSYTFTIKAVDTSGNKNSGVTLTAAPSASGAADTTSPAEVSGLTAAAGNGQVILTWTDPKDGDLDDLEITWTPGGTTPQTVAKGAGTYTATGLTNNTEYTFTVKAKDLAGNRSDGKTIARTPLAPAALVTVEFDGMPQDKSIVLSGIKDLSQSANTQLTVSVSGSFTAYRWFLDGLLQTGKTTSSLTLNAADLTVKQYELTVFVTSGNVEYAKSVTFTVTN
jgi:hypothetical protein